MAETTKKLVGLWGIRLMFQVNEERIFTFRNWNRSVSGRWALHDILHRKPRAEYMGPGAQTLDLEVVISAQRGMHPMQKLKRLEQAIEEGAVEYIYIGGQRIGRNKWYLESMSEAYDWVLNDGVVVQATVQLRFGEYVEKVDNP